MKVTKSQLRKLISEAMEDSSMQSTQMSIARLGEQIKSLELAAKRIEEEIPFDFGDTKSDRAAREAGNVMKVAAGQIRRDLKSLLKSLDISIDDAMVNPSSVNPGHTADDTSWGRKRY